MFKTRHTTIIALLLLLAITGCRQKEHGGLLLEKGREAFKNGDAIEAYNSILQAIDALEEEGNEEKLFDAKAYLGLLYHTMGQDKEAYAIFKSLPLDNNRGRSGQVFTNCLRCMAYYSATTDKDYNKALHYIQKAIGFDKSSPHQSTDLLYTDLLNMAEVYILKGDTARAWQLVNRIDPKHVTKDSLCYSQLTVSKARLMMERKDYTQAHMYATMSADQHKAYKNTANDMLALSIITRVDSMQGNIKGYIDSRNMLDRLRDKVRGDRMRYRMHIVDNRHKMELMRQDEARRRTVCNLSTGMMALIAAALLVLAHMKYRQGKIRRRINEMEKTQFDEDIKRRRMENELMKLKMLRQQGEPTQAGSDNGDMGQQHGRNMETGSDGTRLDCLEKVLEQQHGGFMERAGKLYPHLSHNELLVMGLMRMGKNTAEISQALGISPESLSKARHRLHKKLGLGRAGKLEDFINRM